jgi:hypothetical protein
MFRPDVTSAERPHRPEGGDDIIEGSAPGHGVGVPHQRLKVARPADFLMLEQRPTVARYMPSGSLSISR